MSYESLLFENRDGVARVTLNRPEKLNAMHRALLRELRDCFETIRNDSDVRAVILTGAGRAFAAGADVKELALLDAISGSEASRHGQDVFNLIENLGKPVIAAVRGYALGGGCELAMAATLRIAAESAVFGQPELKLGIIPGYGGCQRLARLVGSGRALDMILTGEPITAREALRIGLVNRVVNDGDLLAAAGALAMAIVANAPIAVRLAIEVVNRGFDLGSHEAQSFEAALFGLCCATRDMKEGTQAFLEKRPARFEGQ